jgi:signal transduction histidine kinase
MFEGEVWYVVVVEKSDIQAPQGWAILRAQVRPVVTSVWVGSVVAAIPGLAVAVVLAVAAARSVGGRIRKVSLAAESLAAGDLSTRVPESGEDEVASLSRSFNTMAGRLEETVGSLDAERERALGLLDANRQLVANVSHELRTPVALIRGQVEALEEDDPQNERLHMALRETARLEQLVSDLFQLASAEAGSLQMTLGDWDISEVVRDAAAPLVELAWRESQVTVVVGAAEPVFAKADRDRLARVLQNLLRNAVRHTPEGGLVRVATSPSPGPVVIVSDTGPGIAREDLPHIFERFYRGDASRARDTGGAGLGLAITREFVEAMGGSISVESPPGEGATFTIQLPAAAGHPPATS